MHGWALTQKGEAAGISEMREGLSAYRATGAKSFRPYHLSLIAEGNTALGHREEALEVIMEGLDWIAHADERFYEPELYRLKGAFAVQSEGMSPEYPQAGIDAERFFRRAIEAARKQNAKSHELRAAIGLGRQLAARGSRDESRAMLASIYNWFTEGFDTADLKEAKALLDELSH
jgi:predicted ATPase